MIFANGQVRHLCVGTCVSQWEHAVRWCFSPPIKQNISQVSRSLEAEKGGAVKNSSRLASL